MIIERAKFNKRSRLPDEPAEQFIASLYNLASHCNFGDLKNELICDRNPRCLLIQVIAKLTLEKAQTLVCQREAVHEQQQTLKGEKIEAPCHVIQTKHEVNPLQEPETIKL